MMRIAPTAGATSACRSTKPAARRCRAGGRDAGAAGRLRTAGIRCWASPGSEADDLAATTAVKVASGPSGHHRLHRQRLLPAAVAHHPHPRLLSEALAGRPFIASEFGVTRSSWRITGAGGDQQLEGAGRGGHWTQKRRPAAERVSGHGGAVRPPGRGPGSGVKAGRASGDGLHLPGGGPPADRPPAGRQSAAAAADALTIVKRCAGAG